MARLRKIRPFAFAKFQAVLMAPVGLIAGILYSFGGAIYELATDSLNSGTALAFFALVGMPLTFAGVGFVAGIIEAFLYNLFARRFGGIEMDFAQEP